MFLFWGLGCLLLGFRLFVCCCGKCVWFFVILWFILGLLFLLLIWCLLMICVVYSCGLLWLLWLFVLFCIVTLDFVVICNVRLEDGVFPCRLWLLILWYLRCLLGFEFVVLVLFRYVCLVCYCCGFDCVVLMINLLFKWLIVVVYT